MTTPTSTLRAAVAALLVLTQISPAVAQGARSARPAAAPGPVVLRLGCGAAKVNLAAAAFSGANLGLSVPRFDLPAAPLSLTNPEPAVSAQALQAKPALAAAQAKPVEKTVLGRLKAALGSKDSETRVAAQFDGAKSFAGAAVGAMGLRPLPAPTLPQGMVLEDAPAAPDPAQAGGISINAMDIPGARGVGGVFDAGPVLLNADPNDAESVKNALLALVAADAPRYGVAPSELSTVHARRVAGTGTQADSVFVVFRQHKTSTNPDGTSVQVEVDGSYLSFTVKVVKGRPYLMAAMARLYPNIGVATASRYSDADLQALAERQLPQNAGITLAFHERRVIFRKATQSWHTVNLYDIEGLPQAVGVRVAVDVATGDVFAWDARRGAADGKVDGTAEMSDTRPNGEAVLSQVPLPYLTLTLSNGKTVTTDADGKFKAELPNGQPLQVSASLSGTFNTINDRANNPVKLSATITAAGPNEFVVTTTASDELRRSQLNVYVNVNRVLQWVTKYIGAEQRLQRQIPANVNINQECNAYYTPGRPSLNFFRSSKNCSDTSKPGVVMHEWGHYFDDMIGGIMNGGLSEGWGDILSMLILRSPIIGDGFLRNRTPSWIRHGENDYQYNENDEAHDVGQAWMGPVWKLAAKLAAKYGEDAGFERAARYVIPTIYAKAADIPSAGAQVLLNAMDKNGKIQDEDEIRAAFKANGVILPAAPGGISTVIAGAASWAARAIVGRWKAGEAEISALAAPAAESAAGVAAAEFLDAPEAKTRQDEPVNAETPARGKLTFSAGALIRGRVKNAIRRHLDFAGLVEGRDYELKEHRGMLSSDFLLVVNGPYKEVAYHLEQVRRLLRNLADN